MRNNLLASSLLLLFGASLGTPLGAWSARGPQGIRAVAATAPCANPGKDGNRPALAGIVNTYFPGVGTPVNGSSSSTISIAASSAADARTDIAAGDLLLIIQMQGADVNVTNDNNYGANNGTGAGNLPTNFTAGTYEYVVASSALAAGAAGTITTATRLVNSYSTAAATATAGRRSFQVVRIPQYGNVTLSGQVNALTWNGSVGGVLAMDVAGALSLANQTLNAAGTGFRGGAGFKYTGSTVTGLANTDYRTLSSYTVNGTKGEGTAGTPRYTAIGTTSRVDNTTATANAFASGVTDGYLNGDNGRGAPGNAGGGATDASPTGNSLNAGGAGGGNGGVGGLGGAPRNGSATPTTGASQALGGVAFAATPSRLVMGGGGGAGSSNDGNGNAANDGLFSSGAPGGGIILVRTGSVSSKGIANASGTGGYLLQGTNNLTTKTNDGTGGGGAGGTVLITARTTTSLANLTVIATGGAGNSNSNTGDVAHGPGGGGSGGIVFANGALAAATVTGGAAGTTTYQNGASSASSTYGATVGANGTSTTNISLAIDNSVAGADCVADLSSTITASSFVNTGQRVTVQATFSNAGPQTTTATGTVTLPAGATGVSAPGGTISVSASNVTTITYALGSLNSGSSVPYTILYNAPTAGTLTVASNIATTSTTEGGLTDNNAASAATTVSSVGAVGTPAACANPGKDGSATGLSGTVNTYFAGTASVSASTSATSISVAASGGASKGIAVGDLLLVIQMQGADINATNTNAYGANNASGSGNLTTNFTAGTYEYVVATSTLAAGVAGTISVASLANSYATAPATTTSARQSFQVVRIPQYSTVTLGGQLTALAWNGSIGGILAIDVAGTLNLNSQTLSAAAAGFRGGAGFKYTGLANTTNADYRTNSGSATTFAGANGTKGEGIAGTPRFTVSALTDGRVDNSTNAIAFTSGVTNGYPNGDNGKGAPGNAGGGGTDDIPTANTINDGGAGGANGGAGGLGGWPRLNTNTNAVNTNNQALGGTAFAPLSSSRLVMGGGGGAGTSNDGNGDANRTGIYSSGAPGGGLILVRTGSIGSSGTADASGGGGYTIVGANGNNDGGGGGGAGGTVLITANTRASLANLTVLAVGGKGTITQNSADVAHGPGGGGGGGVILANGALNAASSAAGGAAGTIVSSDSYNGGNYGATVGASGISNTQISNRISNNTAGANCIADVATTITGPTSAGAGQPTGNFTATFANNGALAATTTQIVTLPTGAGLTAAQQATIVAAYPGTQFTITGTGTNINTSIDFGSVSLAAGASNAFTFAYTAPTTTGSYSTTSATSTTTTEGGLTDNNSATTPTTVVSAADVTVSLAGPTTLNAGQPTGNFTATFTNEGPSIATSVARSLTLPTGATLTTDQQDAIKLAYPAATFTTTGTGNTAVTTINFGSLSSLASNTSSTVGFAFTAPKTTGSSTLTGNTSIAIGTSQGANIAPDQSTLTLNTVESADVVAAITGSSSVVNGTPTGKFDVSFSNIGPQTAAGVIRTVQLPKGLNAVVTGPDAGSYDNNTGIVTYTTSSATIATNSSLTSTITFAIPSGSTLTSATASVSTTTNEAGLKANNVALATLPALYDLNTTLSGPTTAVVGSPMTLYVTTTNNGPNAAPTATQTVTIPSAEALTNLYITNGGTYTYNSVSKIGTVTFPDALNTASGATVTNLTSGQTLTNSISFLAPSADFAPSATVVPNTAAAGETNTTNNLAYLNGNTASTNITVSAATATMANEQTSIKTSTVAGNFSAQNAATVVSANSVVYYSVTSSNSGPAAATSVVQQVQLIPGLTTATIKIGGATGVLVGTTITFAGTETYDTATGVVTFPTVNSQVSGTSTTYNPIAVTVPANAGQLLATATVRSATSDPVPSDNVASVTVDVTSPADLATTITGPSTTVAGQVATYTATFNNNGTSTATSVVETAQLPAGLSNVVVKDAKGSVVSGTYNAATGQVTFPALASDAAGATQVYTVAFTTPGNTFSVSSAISSGTNDNVVTNNSSSLSTTVSSNADVAISVSGPATAVAGNTVTYAVTTTNNGPNAATGVAATLKLPAGLTTPGNAVTVSGGTYDNSTGIVTFTSYNLAASDSRVALVSFTMPSSQTSNSITGAAAVTTTSTDAVASNNTAAVTTSVAPATPDMADLATTISSSATSSVTAGTQLTYTLNFTNNSALTAAINVVPTAYLPVGLTGVVVKDATGTVVPNAYNSTTGQVTFPTIASQAAGNTTTYTVNLPAPANDLTLGASAVSTDTSDPSLSNNYASNSLTITSKYDAITTLAGPLTALPGSTNTYTVTTKNNGPSTATDVTSQTVTLPGKPAASAVTNISGNGTYDASTGIITFPSIAAQAAGVNGEVVNTFTVTMPTTGNLVVTAKVTSSKESDLTNNNTSLTTAPANLAPVADNVWNTLQSARGNTANLNAPTGLAISPLVATDADGTINVYAIASLPSTSQGILYFNNSPVISNQTVTASGLTFAPATGFVGNATFTYVAVDNGAAVSNTALYTIPVAKDNTTVFTVVSKAAGAPYANQEVIANGFDANGGVYNAVAAVTDNGIRNATTDATGTTTLAGLGISLDPVSGQLKVIDATKLKQGAYSVNITTTDVNGGVTTQAVPFNISLSPLPVVLAEFTAQAVANRDALLTWHTASEQHNDHFEVERSFDGTTFTKVGQLAGHGTTSATSAYVFTDGGVGAHATGTVYYRLRQVDLDGTAIYSPQRTLRFAKVAAVRLGLYPNPVASTTTLDLSALPATSTCQVALLDATGRQVRTWTLGGGQRQPLELTSLASGTYLLVVSGQQPDGALLTQSLRLTKE